MIADAATMAKQPAWKPHSFEHSLHRSIIQITRPVISTEDSKSICNEARVRWVVQIRVHLIQGRTTLCERYYSG
jgi:hypothetical protein